MAARFLPRPTDVISYGAGLAEVRFPSFLSGTVIGLTPWLLAESLIGASMQSFSTTAITLTPEFVAGMGLLGLLLFFQPLFTRVQGIDR